MTNFGATVRVVRFEPVEVADPAQTSDAASEDTLVAPIESDAALTPSPVTA